MKKAFISFMVLATFGIFSLAASAGDFFFVLGFDEGQGDVARDSSGDQNDGSVVNAEWVTNGKFGGALEFNGTDSYVEVEADVPEADFTMSVWIKTENGNGGIMSVLDGPAGAGGHDRHIYLQDGKVCFRVWKGVGWCTEAEVADGEWHNIALVTKTGEGQTAYVDGKEVGTFDYDHSDFDWQKRVWIGFSNDAANNYFEGLIDEPAYLNVAVPADGIGLFLESTAVEPADKLSTTWGNIKR